MSPVAYVRRIPRHQLIIASPGRVTRQQLVIVLTVLVDKVNWRAIRPTDRNAGQDLAGCHVNKAQGRWPGFRRIGNDHLPILIFRHQVVAGRHGLAGYDRLIHCVAWHRWTGYGLVSPRRPRPIPHDFTRDQVFYPRLRQGNRLDVSWQFLPLSILHRLPGWVDVADRLGDLLGPRGGGRVVFQTNKVGLLHLVVMIKVNSLPLRFVIDQHVAVRQVLGKLVLGLVINQLVAWASLVNGQQIPTGCIIVVDEGRGLRVWRVFNRNSGVFTRPRHRVGGHRCLIRRVARHHGAGHRCIIISRPSLPTGLARDHVLGPGPRQGHRLGTVR